MYTSKDLKQFQSISSVNCNIFAQRHAFIIYLVKHFVSKLSLSTSQITVGSEMQKEISINFNCGRELIPPLN